MKRDSYGERIPTLSTKEALILELLLACIAREMYGLEIVNRSGGKLKRGTVYVTLSRMEDKGFVESHMEQKTTGEVDQPRRVYRPTGYGCRVYEAWQMAVNARRLMLSRTGGLL